MNKTISKLTAFFLAVVIVFAMSPAFVANAEVVPIIAEGTCGENLTWRLNQKGILNISGSGDMYDWDYVEDLPWVDHLQDIYTVMFGKEVTSIGNTAFAYCENLGGLVYSAGANTKITSIGDAAFEGCTNLFNVTIPDRVKTIGYGAFYGCRCLRNVKFGVLGGYQVETIGKEAFADCEYLVDLELPDTVKTIGEGAFSGCKSLKSFTIPTGVTSVPESCFDGCSSLTSISIPYTVKTIGDGAFAGCVKLTTFSIPSAVTAINAHTFSGCTKLTSFVVSDGITSVGAFAFSYCTGLESITLSKNITEIAYSTFAGCSSLKSITIPDKVTLIDRWAFEDCINLQSITIPDSVTTIKEHAFSGCDKLTDVYYAGSRSQFVKINGYDIFNPNVTIHYAVETPLKITKQPSDYTDVIGSTAKFSVTAQGEGLKYQWQTYTSGTWKNSSLPGYNTATLSVPVIASRNGYKFRCVVTDYSNKTATSNAAKLTVTGSAAVSITTQPKNYSGAVGSTAAFKVVAQGTGLKYQWQTYTSGTWKNSSLPGYNTATLSVPVIASRNGYKFRCVVTDSANRTATSNAATLTVTGTATLSITTQPKDYSGAVGSTATFKVVAQGTGLKYQWQTYRSGTWVNSSLPGYNTATLSVPVIASRNGYNFRCVVTDSNGKTVTSNKAILRVTA